MERRTFLGAIVAAVAGALTPKGAEPPRERPRTLSYGERWVKTEGGDAGLRYEVQKWDGEKWVTIGEGRLGEKIPLVVGSGGGRVRTRARTLDTGANGSSFGGYLTVSGDLTVSGTGPHTFWVE